MAMRKGTSKETGSKAKATRMSFGLGSYVKSQMRSDFWADLGEPRFVMYDYEGKGQNIPTGGVCCLKVSMQPVDPETYDPLTGEKPDVNYYGCGRGMKATSDGLGFVSVKGSAGPPEDTNLNHFIKSIVDAGFEMSGDEQEISVLDNMIARIVREPQPKRDGLEGSKDKNFLLVQEIAADEDEDEKPKKKKKKKAAKGQAGKASSQLDKKAVRNLARATLRTMLEDGDDIEISEVETIAANHLVEEGKEMQEAVYSLLTDEEFLESQTEKLEFSYDSDEGVISPGGSEDDDDDEDDD